MTIFFFFFPKTQAICEFAGRYEIKYLSSLNVGWEGSVRVAFCIFS